MERRAPTTSEVAPFLTPDLSSFHIRSLEGTRTALQLYTTIGLDERTQPRMESLQFCTPFECGREHSARDQVSGELLDHLTCWDELRAVLPVGTICGAPKVKAMELIDQLEVGRRGPYRGGFGGISFSGDMDIGLVLRKMVFMNGPRYDTMYSYTDASKCQEWVAHLQSEAQIVADSDPDEKQKECENRVACLCRVIDLSESTFVKGKSSVLEINGSVPNLFSMARVHEKKKLTSQMK
ncbi:hypothetical protein KY285_029020 [Solanum tuberosum]|nr:hypothetical protein KY285_029020 [Solanum tuberosum]